MKSPSYKLALRVLLSVLFAAAGGYFLAAKEFMPSLLLFLLAATAGVQAIRLYLHKLKEVAFLFNAIENNDFNFKFMEIARPSTDRLFSSALNRIRDILADAKIEAAEREKYYELILESVATGIVIADAEGMVYLVNGSALKILGMTRLTHLVQLKKLDPELADKLLASTPGCHLQYPIGSEKSTTNLSVTVSGVRAQGKEFRILAISDIGGELDEKESESWMRLIRVLTHEIMNSITPIVSLSDSLIDLVGEENEENKDIRAGLETIRSMGGALISFVDSYRKLTRIPAPQMAPFYLAPFLERMAQLARIRQDPSPAKLSVKVSPKDLMLYADENLLGQVFINLLNNATEALSGASDGEISISAYENSEQKIIVRIANNGPKIPPEIAEQIFVPFFTTKERGSGIGLSLSKQIMRLHGGSIRHVPSAKEVTFELSF